jgi:hypothetical protein
MISQNHCLKMIGSNSENKFLSNLKFIENFNCFFSSLNMNVTNYLPFSHPHTLNYTAVTLHFSLYARAHRHTHTHTYRHTSCFAVVVFIPHSFFSFHITLCMLFYVDRRRRTHTWLLYIWKKATRETCTSCLCVFFSFTTAWLGHISLLFVVHS